MKDSDAMKVLADDAQRQAFGMPSEQCPICGMAAPKVQNTSKEAAFQNEYGIHYICARDAKSAEYLVFEKEFKPLQDVAAKKREQERLVLEGQKRIDAEANTATPAPTPIAAPETDEVPGDEQ